MIKKTALIMACLLMVGLTFNNTVQAQTSVSEELQTESTNYRASFGDKRIVSIGSPVPSGWVITWKAAYSMQIQYVVGAPVGYSLTVSKDSPVPHGWVIEWKSIYSMGIEYVG
ncbi:hypothetical protein HZI73_12200 [Vallitalea pronyensis]|uniref:Uncharacterized protein n=1 Tax=Vallitalea pronyensis TaxID=1348613 RepID=A0A8J8SGW8_9FIRM|nr:hypothetical protein [Vallitalea pronyensis]QUI23006.1 hypothetical protein HZI73_12200 [Vallitalea pronyensis]